MILHYYLYTLLVTLTCVDTYDNCLIIVLLYYSYCKTEQKRVLNTFACLLIRIKHHQQQIINKLYTHSLYMLIAIIVLDGVQQAPHFVHVLLQVGAGARIAAALVIVNVIQYVKFGAQYFLLFR